MAHVNPARRIREHLQRVELGPIRGLVNAIETVLLPLLLPFWLHFFEVCLSRITNPP